jgi:glycosyltransferase involved in cell wall biosynthesis
VAGKAILVPTAERDPAIGLSIFAPVFRGVRAFMYNSFEERAMIRAVSGNDDVPGVVVGIGSELPARTEPARFRQAYDLRGPFVIYVGRIDENKGCKELFDFFQRHLAIYRPDLTLVLVGNTLLPIPDDPQVRHLGFLSDQDKFDAIAASDALVMPSYFESLSMVALEAWGLGRPVIANARCDVLQGQCLRSNAGLFYESFDEFSETLRLLTTNRRINRVLGENGRGYYARHYAWPVIEAKYESVLAELAAAGTAAARPMEPVPGFFARRRRSVAAAREVLARVPVGAAEGHRRDDSPERPDRRTA